MTTTCPKCKKEVKTKKDILICSSCKNCYHVQCTAISLKLFDIMEPEKKMTWRCKGKNCSNKQKYEQEIIKSNTPSSSNITIRRNIPSTKIGKKIGTAYPTTSETQSSSTPNTNGKILLDMPISNSFDSLLSQDDSKDSDTTTFSDTCADQEKKNPSAIQLNRSFPDLSSKLHIEDELELAKTTILSLQQHLEIAENEISKQLSENYDLKKKVAKCEQKISTLLSLCASTPAYNKSVNISQSNKNKSKNSYNKTKIGIHNTIGKNFSNASLQELHTKQSPHYVEQDYSDLQLHEDIATLQEKIVTLQLELASAMKEIEKLTLEIKIWKSFAEKEPSTEHGLKSKTQVNAKICIISSTSRDILLMSQRYFENSNFIHYKKSNGGIIQLLENLESKLYNYTLNDYCIIFIGKSDFESTIDYGKMVSYIKTTLKQIRHTNIILCLPCFNCNNQSTLFNKRIEAFNRQLCRDNTEHEYAYILDSNKNLKYDYTMFSKISGTINRHGTSTIFYDLSQLVASIKAYTFSELETQEFFRK